MGIPENVLLKTEFGRGYSERNQATLPMKMQFFQAGDRPSQNSGEKAILCCKTYHARRSLMYYQLLYPET